AGLVPGVDVRALLDEPLNDRVHPQRGGAVQCGVAGIVDRVDVASEIEEEGYGLEGQPLVLVRYLRGVFSGVRIVVGEIPTILDGRGRTTRPRVSDPRSRHERRGPIIAGQRWTGAGGNQGAHHVELEESGRQPQRRRPNPALDECKVVAPASQASAFRRSG